MRLRLSLIHPKLIITNKNIQIKIPESLDSNGVIDWVFYNKQKILKESGCNLNDHEISCAIAMGLVNIKII